MESANNGTGVMDDDTFRHAPRQHERRAPRLGTDLRGSEIEALKQASALLSKVFDGAAQKGTNITDDAKFAAHADLANSWPVVTAEDETMTASEAAFAGQSYRRFTAQGVNNLHDYFVACDFDRSGTLSKIEVEQMLTAFGLHLGQVKDALVDKLEELGHRRRGLQRMDKEAVAAQQHSYAESILKAAKKTAVAAHLASEDNASPGSPRGQIPTEAPMDDSLNFDELCCGLCDILDDHFSGESDFILERDDISKLHALQCNDKKVGYAGTTWRTMPSTTWILTNCMIIVCAFVCFGAILWFKFILIPLLMAYFLTFLIAPLLDLMSQRPLICMGRVFCKIKKLPREEASAVWRAAFGDRRPLPHPTDISYPYDPEMACCHAVPPMKALAEQSTLATAIPDFLLSTGHEAVTTLKIPFPLALLGALVSIAGFLYGASLLIAQDISTMLEDEKFMNSVEELLVKTKTYLLESHAVMLTDFDPVLLRKQLAGNYTIPTQYTREELQLWLQPYIEIGNEVVLTLLLCLYLLAARNSKTEYDHHRAKHAAGQLTIMDRIELMNRNYVILKTKLSLVTAVTVGCILGLLKIKLWLIWGVLTFVLNFIPNVGSLIAMALPIPVIMVDQELSFAQYSAALLLPVLVQGYVGNVLEPQMFGKSLNLTALSVLVALVAWTSVWGICGAILSVPLLGVIKILLNETDHPMAKRLLELIREDSSVDEEAIARDNIKHLSGWLQQNKVSLAKVDRKNASYDPEQEMDGMVNPLGTDTANRATAQSGVPNMQNINARDEHET